MTTMFRCLSCNIDLFDNERQREHYKQEWHSYNLKRKLTKLPSVSYETYKRIEQQYIAKNAVNDEIDEKQSFYCQKCGKDFKNEKSFNQHLKSKKHFSNDNNLDKRMDLTSIESNSMQSNTNTNTDIDMDDNDSEWSDVDSDESDCDIEMDSNQCLFCEQISESLEDNVCHMNIQHSFFIPDIEYVTDLEELIIYLHEKITLYFECIWCCDTGKRFKSKLSAQQHMIDMGHTKMRHSDHYLLEYSPYYDYSTSYPDSNQNEDNHQEVDIQQLIDDDWQLKLPSGAVIGHRSLFRYYKQNLRPINTNVSKSAAILGKIVTQYRSLGWTGTTGDAAIIKAKDIKFMNAIKTKYHLKLGQKHNSVLQRHFRNQNPL